MDAEEPNAVHTRYVAAPFSAHNSQKTTQRSICTPEQSSIILAVVLYGMPCIYFTAIYDISSWYIMYIFMTIPHVWIYCPRVFDKSTIDI